MTTAYLVPVKLGRLLEARALERPALPPRQACHRAQKDKAVRLAKGPGLTVTVMERGETLQSFAYLHERHEICWLIRHPAREPFRSGWVASGSRDVCK